MIGDSALGKAWRNTRRARLTPFRVAISMNGAVRMLITAARVIRIMCATTTTVSVAQGKASATSWSQKPSFGLATALEFGGSQPSRIAKTRISR